MKKILYSLTLLLSMILLLNFYKFISEEKISNTSSMKNGTNDTVIVKFDSTAEMILLDSSKNIFSILRIPNSQKISSIKIPLTDQAPKKFTLIDKELGFTTNTAYYVTIFFNDKTNIWEEIDFTPFLPSNYQSEESLRRYLNEWISLINNAGWKEYKTDEWKPYQLPKGTNKSNLKTYAIWVSNQHQITLLTQRNSDPKSEYNKYNLRIIINNKSNL